MTRPSATFRIEGRGERPITSLDDWLEYAPPKKREKHWRPGRSAMESARAWLTDGRPAVPSEIAALLDSHDLTRGFRPELAIPELVTRLDDFRGEHRNHDLIVVGEAAGGRTLLAIEAKADESFGDHTIQSYLQLCARRVEEYPAKLEAAQQAGKLRLPQPSNAAARIEQICAALFGPAPEGELVAPTARPLRYQLATALAGALIEGRARECVQVVLLVHEFVSTPDPARGVAGTSPSKVQVNALAFESFVMALGLDPTTTAHGGLLGPISVPGGGWVPGDLPALIGKATRRLGD